MCGIAGIVSLNSNPVPVERIKPMCDVQAHRGPDDAGYAFFRPTNHHFCQDGYWCGFADPAFKNVNEHLPVWGGEYCRHELASGGFKLALGHRRLAIQDLSHFGHQPMSNSNRRYWIVFNGEIYNYPELREDLKQQGFHFRSNCDTEVILHLWTRYGVDAIEHLNGMFAFALYDRIDNKLYIARDRFGVKPIYMAQSEGFLLFSSEIKGILASGLLKTQINPNALVEYFTFQNTLGRQTLFDQVSIVEPGQVVCLTPGQSDSIHTSYFYDQFPAYDSNVTDADSLVTEVVDKFSKAVTRQLISDVPVGSYLSGGMDSGSIVAVAGRTIPRLLTFTMGFDLTNVSGVEQGFDEREMSEELSHLLQTEHYEVVLHAGDMRAALDKITWHMDDPRVGMCHPNWYAAKLSSRFVKVCLAGAGGDELFGGYPWRYRHVLDATSIDEAKSKYFAYWSRLVPENQRKSLFAFDGVDQALEHTSQSFENVFNRCFTKESESDKQLLIHQALMFEFRTFMHGLLVTEDRISMAHGMESRVPFLDNELAELAWRIPPSLKVNLASLIEQKIDEHINSTDGKVILRRAMGSFLPSRFTQQHKQGFSPPDENWYRGPSMDYIRDILFDSKTRQRPWFNQGAINEKLEDHFQGRQNNRLLIWSLLSVEWLHRHYIDKSIADEWAVQSVF